MTAPPPSPDVDYSRKWMVMAAVGTGVLMATIDGSIVNVAFPTLVEELDTSFNVIQWVALGYLLTIATFTLGMGRLGDVIGKKTLFAIGFGLFTLASVLCGLSPDVGWLIGFRIFQAFGAVMILALGSAILVEAFPPSERGKALGWIGTVVSLGIITGPVVGGILISTFSWRAIFFVNVPVGLFGIWLAVRNVHRSAPDPGQRFDVVGAVLMSVSLLSMSLALTLGQDFGFTALPIVAALALSAIAGAGFVFVELRVDSPMLQLRLFRNPMLSVSVVTGSLVFFCLSATIFLLPFYLEGVLGLEVGTVGLLLGVSPLLIAFTSPYAGTLSDRIGIRRLTLTGLVIMALAYLGLLTLDTDSSALHYAALAIPIGVGIGIFQSPNNSAIMGSVPREYMGVGGGLLHITRLLGQISGVAVLGSIWAVSVASAAGGSLPEGGASAASPAEQVAGLHTTFVVAASIMALAVLIGWWGLHHENNAVTA